MDSSGASNLENCEFFDMNRGQKALLVGFGILLSPFAKGEDAEAKAMDSIQLKENWSVSDLKALAKKLAAATPEADQFKVTSIRFYDLEDSIELVIKKERKGEGVGGWRVKVTMKEGKYVQSSREWFDI